MALSIDTIPNRNSPPAILLRKAWREGTRIRRKTLANLSKAPPEIIDGLRAMLKGGTIAPTPTEHFQIQRALPHGHVMALLAVCKELGLERLLHRTKSRNRDLALAAIITRLIAPGSKLASARAVCSLSASTSVGTLLGLGEVSGNEMLAMLDWLGERQPWIERRLRNRSTKSSGPMLLLYDVSSSFVEGQCCSLATFGHNRDGKKGKKQIVYGLLCDLKGYPVAIEVFRGNTDDPSTLVRQMAKIRSRFDVQQVGLVGDRGLITSARIREDLNPAKMGWISALTTKQIRKLLKHGDTGPALQPDQLLPDAVAEITSVDFPGERLMVCLNPRLRDERARKREDLLQATERILAEIARIVHNPRAKLKGRDAINRRIGQDLNRRKVGKHFDVRVTDDAVTWTRKQDQIAAEACLDGIYVIRTNLAATTIDRHAAVERYKSLAQVEQAFRTLKTTRLKIRPLHVYRASRVRAHVFLCMLSYLVEIHLRAKLAPLLFHDDDKEAARQARSSPVAKAEVSAAAKQKASRKKTMDDLPVHSMTTLLAELGSMTLNEVVLPNYPEHKFTVMSEPTPVQKRVMELLGINKI